MKRLLSYYGDDFTGSTDVMEALSSHGVETVLFTRLPTAHEFAPFAGYGAFGLAGTSRSQTPRWMDENLPQAFDWLKSLGARFCHYKVCSTFDSAPQVGSIGRAAEVGAKVFSQNMVPLIVGAPQLKRFTFAGNLFAGYQGEIWRIDRHPVMSRHPVTPMHEADLRLHLAQQTMRPVRLANAQWPDDGIALVDIHDALTQLAAGQRLLEWPGGFVVGSSGVEYAIVKAMNAAGELGQAATFPKLGPVPQTVVVSGSVSPTTERQITYASQNGFETVALDAVALASGELAPLQQATESALRIVSAGRSPLLHTALGPLTDEGGKLSAIAGGRRQIGLGLGAILKSVLERTRLRRAIVAGGDSSSHALSMLDIHALTTRMPIPATPGSPLCRAHAAALEFDGLEIALKGGQLGGDDYFCAIRDGRLSG